jgi:phosphatidate phosphatase APP1
MIAGATISPATDSAPCVMFYPTFGRRAVGGWNVLVHGAVFREGVDDYRRRFFLGLLRRVLKARREEFESEIFRENVAGFLLREQPGRRMAIELGTRLHLLAEPSKRNGHFRAVLYMPDDEAAQLQQAGVIERDWVHFQCGLDERQPRTFSGAAQLIHPQGVSIISDIDDTLKHSGVSRRKALLTNTFLRKFEGVAGMVDVFRRWAADGAAFHYVSSSPWQLFPPLKRLLDLEGYPPGSFHLKTIRFRDPSVLRLFVARRQPKRREILSILQAFPERRFVLVGDSCEKDPEIYGAMARKFPQQIVRIYIRNIPDKPLGVLRAEKAFRGVSSDSWRVFRDAQELEPVV